ncbi:hypothetical protein GCM10028784_24330 [Myceligenerans cantabricum]
MSTNEPGSPNPYDPPTGGDRPGQDPPQPGTPPQPSGREPQPGQAPPPSPYQTGGAPPPGTPYQTPPPPASPYPGAPGGMQYAQVYPKNGLGVWSLVLGIASFVICPVIASIGAIVTGHMTRRAVREGQADNGGMGLAGIILGWASLVLTVVAIIIVTVALSAAVNNPGFQDIMNDPSMWATMDTDY